MQQWFYEMYGFYPLEMVGGVFYMNHTKYELVPIVDDEPWGEYETLIQQVCQQLQVQPITIIKNRQNQYVSDYEAMKYILIAGNGSDLILSHVMQIHAFTFRKKTLDIRTTKAKWIERTDHLEHEIIPWLPRTLPNYDQLIVDCYVALGMAENAVLYVSTIPQMAMIPTCLCNKRIEEMSSWVVCNPLHVIFDHPARDIAELVKLDLMSDEDVFAYIENNRLTEPELSYLVARLLFPFQLFDCAELLYTEQGHDIKMSLNEYELQIQRIIALVRTLLIRYSLRPIEWILR